MANTPRNQIVQRPQGAGQDFDDRGKKFTTFINGNAIKNLLTQSLGGPQQAAQLTSTLISVVSQNEKLQKAPPMQILAAALRFEVGMGLSYVLGDYSIIPYENKKNGDVTAQGQLQVNGIKRMCIASGAYKKIDCFDVREGEFLGRDPDTREPIIKWLSDEEREQYPIIGYYAFYTLNDAYNGFTNKIYWTYDKILRHADRYSKAFDLEIWRQIQNGVKSGTDKWGKTWYADRKREGTPWYGDSTDDAHMKMCAKTMYKQLLGDGFAPKSTTIQNAIAADNAEEAGDEPVIYADTFDAMAREAALADARVQPQIEAGTAPNAYPAETTPHPSASQTPSPQGEGFTEAPKKRGRPGKAETASGSFAAPATANSAPMPMDDAEPLPFDDEDPFA